MKKNILLCILVITSCLIPFSLFPEVKTHTYSTDQDSLPTVLPDNKGDLVNSRLRDEALIKFATHQLPDNLNDWNSYKNDLRKNILKKTGAVINHDLALDMVITSTLQMSGYIIQNIYFQTRPGVYATANLYIPDGKGPFPGVVVMSGHSSFNGRLYEPYQSVGHTLAANGYVALSIDPWGAGERTTKHGEFEYHGANLGASLMNIGESLMGMHITDNMRGVDLLCSLPFVDNDNIGATGTSGGGNQTMWLAAMDERVKAAVPVTSVGTFESYVMRVNCVCETLIDGLTFTEEAAVLALARAIMPINAINDNPTFTADEMLRSYNNAKPIFELRGSAGNIDNRIFDLRHGYLPEYRQAMLGWFDLKLKGKGDGSSKEEAPFELVPTGKLMTFAAGKRDSRVLSTEQYCMKKGEGLREAFLSKKSFNLENKREELAGILRIDKESKLKKAHQYSEIKGWKRFALETNDRKLIPLLIRTPQNSTSDYTILVDPMGKNNLSLAYIDQLKQKGDGIVIVDLSGTGETASAKFKHQNFIYHNFSRSLLWLGKTVLGEWAKEIDIVTEFLKSDFEARGITLEGNREAGLACLLLGAVNGDFNSITLRDAPVSYLFDNRENIDYYTSAIFLPRFLNWGDVSLATSLTGADVTFINPLTMSGQVIDDDQLENIKAEFDSIRKKCNQGGQTFFLIQ